MKAFAELVLTVLGAAVFVLGAATLWYEIVM